MKIEIKGLDKLKNLGEEIRQAFDFAVNLRGLEKGFHVLRNVAQLKPMVTFPERQ